MTATSMLRATFSVLDARRLQKEFRPCAGKASPELIRQTNPRGGEVSKSGWTDERFELAKKLWNEGKTATQIADRIGGGLSRNAVIGKLSRDPSHTPRKYGTGNVYTRKKKDPISVERRAAPRRVAKVERVPTFSPEPDTAPLVEIPVVPPNERKALVDLETGDCRWPIEDPLHSPDFGFCGRPAIPGMPYCTGHHRVAYVPIKPKEKGAGGDSMNMRRSPRTNLFVPASAKRRETEDA